VGKDWAENYEYDVANAPCGQVVREGKFFYCRDRVQEIPMRFSQIKCGQLYGSPAVQSAGQLVGNLCVIDSKPPITNNVPNLY
jgi:hypothetical protein